MTQTNNIMSPLPFYSDISMQQHRKDYAYGAVYPLITRKDILLPFQFNIEPSNSSISKVVIMGLNNNFVLDVTQYIKDYGLKLNSYEKFSSIVYPANFSLPANLLEGPYYLVITTNIQSFYSDVFTVVYDVSRYLYIEYRNSQNLELANGIVDFADNFTFKCYLDSQIGKPEYNFEEEATERMGYTFIESQVSKKLFKFTFIAPEYLCDALRIIRLCDSKTISSRGRTYELTAFALEPTWEDQGDLAAVEAEFETDTVIATIGGYKPELLGGDFNSDFNNDYKTE